MKRGAGGGAPGVKIELDPEVIVARAQGRKGWLREARHQLDEHRRRRGRCRSHARGRSGCLEAERRMQENLAG